MGSGVGVEGQVGHFWTALNAQHHVRAHVLCRGIAVHPVMKTADFTKAAIIAEWFTVFFFPFQSWLQCSVSADPC